MRRPAMQDLGIDIPIVLAPMGGAVAPRLAAAVSNAGGLGTLPLWRTEIETLRRAVQKTRSLTSKPFAVNLNMEFPQAERLDACLEEKVPVISFFWRDPGELVKRAKAGGAVVMYTVGNADDARRAVDIGVDVVVAQGWEAGGHVRGTVATLPLVPAVVDAVGDTPVIAAGGIADGRGMAAALALGAAGVWVGTRFLASEEVSIHPEYQRRILAASGDRHGLLRKSVRRRLAQCAASRAAQLDHPQLGGRGPAACGATAGRRRDRGQIGVARRCRPLHEHHAGTGYCRRYRGAITMGGAECCAGAQGAAGRRDRSRDE